MFYAMAFLLMGSLGEPIDWSDTVPEFREFQRRIWAVRSSWRTGRRRLSMAGFIGKGSCGTCSRHDSAKH